MICIQKNTRLIAGIYRKENKMSENKKAEIPEKGFKNVQKSFQSKVIKKTVPSTDQHAPAPGHENKN